MGSYPNSQNILGALHKDLFHIETAKNQCNGVHYFLKYSSLFVVDLLEKKSNNNEYFKCQLMKEKFWIKNYIPCALVHIQ